jgi:hypothetical protein
MLRRRPGAWCRTKDVAGRRIDAGLAAVQHAPGRHGRTCGKKFSSAPAGAVAAQAGPRARATSPALVC